MIRVKNDFGQVKNINAVFVHLLTIAYVKIKNLFCFQKINFFILSSANRCYKYYSTPKNQSAARDDCRKDQADLFSWRDNSDEIELITASTAQWNSNTQFVVQQLYSWGGGMIDHGRGKFNLFI